jgi:hypothetical protein
MKTSWIALAAASLAASAAAQAPSIQDAKALEPQREAMRKVWKLQPGKPVPLVLPLYGRVMRIDIPAGFVPAWKVEARGQFLFEFTEGDETVQNWKRLITIRSAAGAGASTFEDAFIAEGLFRPATCFADPVYRVLEQKDLGGGLSTIALMTGCGNVAGGRDGGEKRGLGEIDFIRMFRDRESVYSFAIAMRRKAYKAEAPPASDSEALAALAAFGKVLLCRPDAPEGECRDVLMIDRARASQRR